jgi:oligoendopeptidase F
MVTIAQALPHWDMSVVYPGLESPEFEEGFRSLVKSIDDLTALFDKLGVNHLESASLDNGTVQAVEEVIERYNDVQDEMRTIYAYIHAFVTTDSRDDVAQAKLSEMQQQGVRMSQLGTRFTAWIGSLDVEGLIERSQLASDHAYALRKRKESSEHLMSPAEEELASELRLSGGAAWSKLQGNLSSQLKVPVDLPDGKRELPMSAVRNLAFDPDREVRRRGYEAELAAWERAALQQHQGGGQHPHEEAGLGVGAG